MDSATLWSPDDLNSLTQQQHQQQGDEFLQLLESFPSKSVLPTSSSLFAAAGPTEGECSFSQFDRFGFLRQNDGFRSGEFGLVANGSEETGVPELAAADFIITKQEDVSQWSCTSPAHRPLSSVSSSTSKNSSNSSAVSAISSHLTPMGSSILSGKDSDCGEQRSNETRSSQTMDLASRMQSSTIINAGCDDCCSDGQSKKFKSTQSSSGRFATKNSQSQVKRLGERITALQQLVSPFGKTDTASVLLEAIGYIKFLQEQVQALSSPYMTPRTNRNNKEGSDLRSRGLCLVPISCTSDVANNNGADYWISGIGNCGRH